MKFRFIWVGKTKDNNWRALQEEYCERLSHFVKFEIVELKDAGDKEIESKRILENLNPSAFVVLLDVKGRSVSSHELAEMIEKWQNRGLKEIVLSSAARKASLLGLSKEPILVYPYPF